MGVIKQKHEQKSDKRDISRMSRTVVMTRELVRVLVIAVATMVCVGGYKDISAAAESGERAGLRGELQGRVDGFAQRIRDICGQKEQWGYLAIVEELKDASVIKDLNYVRAEAAQAADMRSIVKQCNGLLREVYQCLTDALVYTLTRRLTVKGSEQERSELRDFVANVGNISFIPELYIKELNVARIVGFPTFNFNWEREMREGLARDMNAAILRAADVYNKALEAEGGDALEKFGIRLSREQIAAVKSMAAAPGEAVVLRPPVGQLVAGAKFSDPDFERMLKQKNPDLYKKYQDILIDINYIRWGALYLATLQPKLEELSLSTRAGEEVPLDYVGRLRGAQKRIEAGIAALAENKDVQDRLRKVYKTADDETRENLSIWEAAVGEGAPPQPKAQSDTARKFLEETPLTDLTYAIESYPGDFPGHVYRAIVELQGLLEKAMRDLTREDLEDPKVRDKLEQYRRIKENDIEPIRKAEESRKEQQRLQQFKERSLLQPTPFGSPVVGGGAGATPGTVLSLMQQSSGVSPASAAPLPEPQIEPKVGNLPQSVYKERLAKVRELIQDVYGALARAENIPTNDIVAMEGMLAELETKEPLAYNAATDLNNESGETLEVAVLLEDPIFEINGTVKQKEAELRNAIARVKSWEQRKQQRQQQGEQ